MGRGRKTHREGPNTPSATNTESIMKHESVISYSGGRGREREGGRGRERRRWKESLVLREKVEGGGAYSNLTVPGYEASRFQHCRRTRKLNPRVT